MANVLSTDKQVRVGQGCASLLDQKMRNLPCQNLQFDEIRRKRSCEGEISGQNDLGWRCRDI